MKSYQICILWREKVTGMGGLTCCYFIYLLVETEKDEKYSASELFYPTYPPTGISMKPAGG